MEITSLEQLAEEIFKNARVYPDSEKLFKGPMYPELHAEVEEMLSKVVNLPPEYQAKKP
ncbi:hypothetical protein HHL16_08900 [Pseudoflavitalea sp. G-6-1-2]|uniref:hypothetical protein n=1 Tax=Pseudoflavitalea sp. G-6-1-2 TaxID=2728841 RepID=UPI00146ACE49|nr:hypothetical protein [Pseudoflavitalea sp. G-6-1-2]NML20990.1 hypothetical protein [Pseudoflavitalea sp. G-6-1-2]